MFEDLTPERIRKNILDSVGMGLETREGSFLATLVGPVSVELWKMYQALNALVPVAYVDESSGGYIDLRCAEFGISRKAGTRAKAVIVLTGKAGTVLPAGTAFLTDSGLAFELTAPVVLAAEPVRGEVQAAEVGAAYNVEAGEVNQMVVTLPGLTDWCNEAATGGTDAERDASLVGRLYDRLQKPATSGNTHHYEQWAKEVEGIGDAKVTALWDGPGTVKVLVVGPETEPVAAEAVARCVTHIEELRPVGAVVTVVSAEALPIHVSAVVTTDGSVTAEQVKGMLGTKLDAYLKSIAFRQYTLLYNRVAFLLLDIDGVTDYASLTVNGGTDNVDIGANQVPTLGAVTVA